MICTSIHRGLCRCKSFDLACSLVVLSLNVCFGLRSLRCRCQTELRHSRQWSSSAGPEAGQGHPSTAMTQADAPLECMHTMRRPRSMIWQTKFRLSSRRFPPRDAAVNAVAMLLEPDEILERQASDRDSASSFLNTFRLPLSSTRACQLRTRNPVRAHGTFCPYLFLALRFLLRLASLGPRGCRGERSVASGRLTSPGPNG